jgi:argininosuccinate synthase
LYNRSKYLQEAPNKVTLIDITFKDGVPVKVKNQNDNTVITDSLEIFLYLNKIGAENGIGRLDMVENRFVGIKSRGVYEAPGATILYRAHQDIEGIAMDREVMRLRDMLSAEVARLIYNGFWFSPEMDFLMSAINKSQEAVDGTVTLELYKGNVYPVSRVSDSSLYDEKLSSMDVEGGFNQEDSKGFIRINAVRLMAHNRIMTSKNKKIIEFNEEN